MDDDITDRAQKHHEAHMEIPDPTPFERIISWVKILFATKKVIMLVWAFFFGVAGVAVKGNIDEVNPWKEAAIEVGLIDADPIDEKLSPQDVAKEEALNQLRGDMINLEGKLEAMQEAVDAPVSYDLPEHTHPPPDLAHEHTEYALMNHTHAFEVGEHTHPELSRVVLSSEVKDILESEVKRVFEKELKGHIKLLH